MSKSADAFRTISEVADWLGVPAHVLRFWESKFTQVKPVKRAGGRRYYRPADMQLLGGIRKLLHDEGMTIKGVQKVMRDQGVRHVAAMSEPLDPDLEEAIAGIALDVTDTEEPRGTVLNFERATGGGEDTPQPEAPDTAAAASAEGHEATPPQTADEAVPPAPADPTDTPQRPAEQVATGPGEDKIANDTAKDAPPAEDADPAHQAPDGPATREAGTGPDTAPAPPAAQTERTDSPSEPAPPAPTHPSAAPAETADAATDAPDYTSTPAAAETGDTTTREGKIDEIAAPAPRVAFVTVPDDPADTVDAPASILGRLGTQDPSKLAAQRPALADLATRMSALRARMGSGAKPS